MSHAFLEYFRCPDEHVRFSVKDGLSENFGFFQFGQGVVGYGKCAGHRPADSPRNKLRNVWRDVGSECGSVYLPFNLEEVVENLRLERYADGRKVGGSPSGIVAQMYYALRRLLPVALRRHLQRAYLSDRNDVAFPKQPVDHAVDDILRESMLWLLRTRQLKAIPFVWFWPDGASGGVSMTHDVETATGRDFCESLMDLNEFFGVPASFQIVPEERYQVSEQFLDSIRGRDFEVNVHDLNHDGRLYSDRAQFARRAARINEYGRRFRAAGFRSAILYRRQEWYSELDFSYDMSVPNSGYLDPQRGGCCTVMPYFVGQILELPLTTVQDYSLFNYLRTFSIDLWQKQIDLILAQSGFVSFIVHPDYIMEDREKNLYRELLAYLVELRRRQNVWIAMPGEVNKWWRQRSKMQLTRAGSGWRVEGAGSERARVALASEQNGKLMFAFQE